MGLLYERNPFILAAEGQDLLGNCNQPATASVSDCAFSKLCILLYGSQDNVASCDIIDTARVVNPNATAEEEVNDALFENTGRCSTIPRFGLLRRPILVNTWGCVLLFLPRFLGLRVLFGVFGFRVFLLGVLGFIMLLICCIFCVTGSEFLSVRGSGIAV